jgi:hypothetical protein
MFGFNRSTGIRPGLPYVLSFLLILALDAAPAAARPVHGVVLRLDGEEIARAFESTSSGEVAVPPGETIGPVTVSLLDDNEVEYSVAPGDTTMTGVVADPGVATYAALGDFDFEMTGILDEEMTELVITIRVNGSPVYTSPGIEVHVEEPHQEADGLLIRREGQVLVTIWRGHVEGFLHVEPGMMTDTLDVTFLDPDSVEFTPPVEHFEFDHEIDDPSKVSLTEVPDWSFRLNGLLTGVTQLRVIIFHEDHADFTSPDVPVLVASSAHAGHGESGSRPPVIAMLPPAPSPFAQQTAIRFSLAAPADVSVRVFDAGGRLVRSVHDGPVPAGDASFVWDGTGNNGDRAPTGIYFVEVRTPVTRDIRRAHLVR